MSNPLGTFLSKFTDWKYCPPSSHLWTVNFLLAPRGTAGTSSTSFTTLYNNICNVNARFNAMYSPIWKISTSGEDGAFVSNSQDDTIGMFLAREISFNGNSVITQDSQSGQNQSFTGWVSFGKTQTGRNHNHAAKIKFFQGNWDIIEIFIDKWIAAIGQQGLIEDDTLANIKANIVITEYAASVPNNKSGAWVPKKRITLLRAFPKNRQDTKYDYEPENASDAKFNLVDFEFDGYQVEYLNVGNTISTSGTSGTPGYISGTTAVGTSEVGPTYTIQDIERINAGKNYK